jgi:3-oxoacyl-[acyl-carrier protein] reductase
VHGLRVVNIRWGAHQTHAFSRKRRTAPQIMEPMLQKMKEDTMLKQLPLMEDIANVALLLSSDMCPKITGVTIDVTCGTTAALNYLAVPSSERPSVGSQLTQ